MKHAIAGPALKDPVPMRKRPALESDVLERPLDKQLVTEAHRAEDLDSALILRPPHTSELFTELGTRLKQGNLVSFPTETVYGLGANGLDAQAVLKIFEAKGRPLNDPCILHVANANEVPQLLEFSDVERCVFDHLANACWPGPLSIVGRARHCVPPEVTASTGFAAVRCPDHAVARQLIAAAGVPLAAPSANRFGHISPTQPEHVLDDLGHVHGLRILDGGPCGVGIESTVLKLDLEHGRVVVLRKGGITREKLECVLAAGLTAGTLNQKVAVEYSEKLRASVEVLREAEKTSQVSPGLLLQHYSPSVPTALLSPDEPSKDTSGKALPNAIGRSILIDVGQQMLSFHKHFIKTFDLCSEHTDLGGTGSIEEACSKIFAVLRAAEAFAISNDACLICITDFDADKLGGIAEALHDRLFRAASGCRIRLCSEGDNMHFAQVSGGMP